MHSFANLLTKEDQAQKLAFTKSMPSFCVKIGICTLSYSINIYLCLCVCCSTHWVGYVHNIFKLYTAPYKKTKQNKTTTTERKKQPTTNKVGKKTTDNQKSTILSEAQQRWEREAWPNAPWSWQESSRQRHRALGQALECKGIPSAQTRTWGTLVAYKLPTCKPPQNYT